MEGEFYCMQNYNLDQVQFMPQTKFPEHVFIRV